MNLEQKLQRTSCSPTLWTAKTMASMLPSTSLAVTSEGADAPSSRAASARNNLRAPI